MLPSAKSVGNNVRRTVSSIGWEAMSKEVFIGRAGLDRKVWWVGGVVPAVEAERPWAEGIGEVTGSHAARKASNERDGIEDSLGKRRR